MLKDYLKSFLPNLLGYALGFLVLGIWFVGYVSPYTLAVVVLIFFVLVSYQTHKEFSEGMRRKYEQELAHMANRVQEAQRKEHKAKHDEEIWKQSLIERSSGFPTLLKAIQEYEEINDGQTSKFLLTKSHPARKAAQVVREEARRRREAEFVNKNIKAIIEYYETIAPFLLDFKDDILDRKDEHTFRDYTDEEREDPAINYLTKEEFRKLPSVQRNQMALDRFWARPKSKWLIGRIYERYVGYLYEEKGYDVDYVGIFKGYEDLGRDLICTRNNDLIIIQCKYWAQFRTIYEKHIFQFFGTVFQYRDENPDKGVEAIFYTSTTLSELARRFANELGIKLKESFKFDQEYPSIKCNVSRVDGTKIYHVPFDQQYDKTKVEKERGEFYCKTIQEAEDAGFRRAFRWRDKKEGIEKPGRK